MGRICDKVVDASDLSALFNDFLPKLIGRVAQDDQSISDILGQIVAVGKPMWKHPTALYFGGVDLNGPQPPAPGDALRCGDDAAALADQMTKLLGQIPKDQGPLPQVKTYGSLVVLAFGTSASIDADFAQAPAANLAKAPTFMAGLDQVQHDPAYVEYVDIDAAVKLVDEVIQRMHDPKTTERWQHARDALGLGSLHNGIVTGGFDGPDWMTQAFVSTGAGTNGLGGAVSQFAAEQGDFCRGAAVGRPHGGRQIQSRCICGKCAGHRARLDPSTGDQVDGGLAMVNQQLGLDIRKDFLANLGDEWAVYSDRSIAGPGVLGLVVVNRLKNASAFDNSLNQLTQAANKLIADAMQQPNFKLEFHESVVKGVTIHYLGIPFVTPSWAVKDGNLYLGLYPQVVSGAVEQVSNQAPSILQRPEYIAVMKRLGDHDPCSVEFSNLPATAPDVYGDLLLGTRMYLGYADIYGVHPPAIVVPPLSKIMPELSPSGGVVWTDAAGLHEKSICPFPGSELISQANTGAAMDKGDRDLILRRLRFRGCGGVEVGMRGRCWVCESRCCVREAASGRRHTPAKSAFISSVACSTQADQSFNPPYLASRWAYKMLRLAETIAPWPLTKAARVISPVAPCVP